MTRTTTARRRVAGLLAVLALCAAMLVGADSRGPNTSPASDRGDQIGAVDLVDTSTVYRMVYYPDGAGMTWTGAEVNDLPGGTWYSSYHHMWNCPLSSGCHSDRMYFCIMPAETICSSTAFDSETRQNYNGFTISDNNTKAVKYHIQYGDSDLCRIVYWNRLGNTAVSGC